jgi:hypothetical protein
MEMQGGALRSQHEAHKARLARMGGRKPTPVVVFSSKPKPIFNPINPEDYYPQMWFWDLVDSRERFDQLTIKNIIEQTAAYYHMSAVTLLSNRRDPEIVQPRQLAMYLAATLTGKSTVEIGRRFGGRDHTTVLHAIRKIKDLTSLSHISSAITVISRRFGL